MKTVGLFEAKQKLSELLTGAGPGVAAPRHPLDARPGRGPREPQPGRARAASFAGGGPPLREFRSPPHRCRPQGERCGPRVVERARTGEEIGITRHGKLVAKVVAAAETPKRTWEEIFADLDEYRKHFKPGTRPVSDEEIVAMIHEGHV